VSNDWSAPTDWETVCRRNAGRRHYNAVRRFRQAVRRKQVAELLSQAESLAHGTLARIARDLGVSKSTITRDVQFLLSLTRPCPSCGCRPLPKAS